MTNYEKYVRNNEKKYDDLLDCGIGVEKTSRTPKKCTLLKCEDCLFKEDDNQISCRMLFIEWCSEKYIEPPISLTKIESDFVSALSEGLIYKMNGDTILSLNGWLYSGPDDYYAEGCTILNLPFKGLNNQVLNVADYNLFNQTRGNLNE